MSHLRKPPALKSDKPKATITRIGRFTYMVEMTIGIGGYEFFVFGRKRAEKKARKCLLKEKQHQERLKDRWEIDG